ncbi:amidase [Motilibacter deserti]|uniref:Amidase n=1 Tax=Motilibacter deserti TaxID=2714956 RepID=A0ABX0GQA8_9ACTN|nr:amidase [Motilibacter deserti]NHC12653.1 amidase [Motilibacter deserti]
MTDTYPVIASEAAPVDEQPQDATISRRQVLNRFAWLSAAATGGVALVGPAVTSAAAAAAPRPPIVDRVRPEALADPTELTIAEAVTLILQGRLRPVALAAAYLDRIEEFDGVYQAYAARPSRADVLAAAAAVRIDSRNLLTGVGLAPKDNYYTKGLLTEAGSLVFEGFVPEYDATAVARMKQQGGVVLGKAQMGNLAGGRATVPGTLIPTTRNAWTPDDVRYSPSGSSSGTATAVAARLATSGIGTQTGGSITGPGQAQGLTALKPTFGRVSLHGVVPLTFVRDHPGPLARDAMDAAIMLQALAGPDPNDPRSQGLPEPPDYIRAATPQGSKRPRMRFASRIGVWPGYLTSGAADVRARRGAMARVLEDVGGRMVGELALPDDWSVLSGVLNGSTGDPTAPFVEHLRRDVRLFADRLPRFLNGMLQSADSYLKVQQGRLLLLQRFLDQVFDKCDLVLGAPSDAFDGTGMPLLTFPIGLVTETTTGLQVPTGGILGARPYGEERLLSAVSAYQAVTGFHLQRPPDPRTGVARVARAAVGPRAVTTIAPVGLEAIAQQ